MKNTLRFTALFAILLMAAPVFAQKKENESLQNRAKEQVEKMCQKVQLDDATKQQIVDLTCQRMEANAKLEAQKKDGSLSEEAFKAASKKNSDEFGKNILQLIPSDQQDAYKAWKSQQFQQNQKPGQQPQKGKGKPGQKGGGKPAKGHGGGGGGGDDE